jgi:hypothetical protein
MAIVSTTIESSRQANGTTHVVERHVTDDGREYMRTWFAPAKEDIPARVSEHASELEADLIRQAAEEKESTDSIALDEKILAYAKEQPIEVLKGDVKLTDDEIAVLQKREATVKVAGG